MLLDDSATKRSHVITICLLITALGAAKAAIRMSAVVGGFAGLRCVLKQQTDMPLMSTMIAGAVAVGLPTALQPNRSEFLAAYFADQTKKAFSKPAVIGISAISGAIVFSTVEFIINAFDMEL